MEISTVISLGSMSVAILTFILGVYGARDKAKTSYVDMLAAELKLVQEKQTECEKRAEKLALRNEILATENHNLLLRLATSTHHLQPK